MSLQYRLGEARTYLSRWMGLWCHALASTSEGLSRFLDPYILEQDHVAVSGSLF